MAQQTASNFALTMPSDKEIVMTQFREIVPFNAPRKLVFEAHSKPEHIKRWWGLRSHTMPICEMDFRPGGVWRYVCRDANGQEYGFSPSGSSGRLSSKACRATYQWRR